MSLRDQLHAYISQLEERLRLSTLLRGIAILAGGALVATLALVTIANARAFSQGSLTLARFALILILAVVASAGLIVPLRRLTRRRAVGIAEAAFPQFQQRLTTFSERDSRDPFIELLAADALDLASFAEPKQLVTDRRLWISLGTSIISGVLLIWLILGGPGFLGYGASLLWTGPHRDKPLLYDLRVTPGDAVVRRHADQIVSAIPSGIRSPRVKLHAHFQSSGKWEEIAMQAQTTGSFAGGYQFLFAGLLENVEYYVTAGAMTSKHYSIRVTDLPAVKQIRVTYHYPAWTGMPSEIEERGGDLRAITGTVAELDISTDRPLPGGQILLGNGQNIQLSSGQNNVYHGAIKMEQDGVYHVAGLEQGQTVRLSEDFFIEARKPNPPQIALVRPGQADYHANPIEEITVAAKATGDYALKGLALHYSVNGAPEVTVDLLKQKNGKQADGSTTISLEDFKLVPGDVVSVYATAKDANAEAHTDMIFIEADPFEREFSQSQISGGGGGGGGGGDQTPQISQREKEIVSATFKQQADKNSTQQQATDIAKLLSQSQTTLREQAISLSGRLEARELTDEVKAIADFQKDMLAAANAMAPAAEQLQHEKWKEAIPNEQKALQFLLRAEATFRQIQVAFGSRGGGGGGGGAARDLAALFDLELDTELNQYETRKSAPTSAEQRGKQIEDALKKLDELAKREQDLAQQQRNSTQTAEQKWQQELLQREAEQLQQEMEQQLAQNGQQGQQSQQGQRGGQASSSSSSQSSGSQSGQQAKQADSGGNSQQSGDRAAERAQQAAIRQALDRLRQANDDIRRAASQSASAADSRRAADRLREATDLLGGLEQQDAAGRLDSMAQTADQLAAQQKKQADHVRDLVAQANAARTAGKQPVYPSREEVEKMVSDRQQVSDDLTHLTQQMRSAARELAPTQPGASTKLRSALDTMDENDLGTRLQRSSDWLRSGNFSDPLETGLTGDLQKLGQQVRDAARSLGNGQQNSREAALNRAMDDLSRLRDQLSSLTGRSNSGSNESGRAAQSGGQGGQSGQQPGQNGPTGQGARQAGQTGGVGDRLAGPVGNPGGAGDRNRQAFGAYDTGNTRISGRAVTPQQGPNPADTQREIDQGLNLLNQVRTVVQDNPEAEQQLQSLIEQMRNLDPSRFPGNPRLVEQMHQQLMSEVDALELQLRRALEGDRGGTIRNADPAKIPSGYRESVADYYRRLSAVGH